MSDTPSKIKEFVNYARSLKGYEKGEAQVFCDRLFQSFGHRGCVEAGAKLEYRLKSKGKHTKFPDLVWRPRLLLEMKSRGEKLEEHIQQARDYWADLPKPKPQYIVLCNFDEFWIYDTTLQIEEPVNRVKLEELPKRYTALNFLFPPNSAINSQGKGTAFMLGGVGVIIFSIGVAISYLLLPKPQLTNFSSASKQGFEQRQGCGVISDPKPPTNIRTETSEFSDKLGEVSNGTRVEIYERRVGERQQWWLRVIYRKEDGSWGWVAERLVKKIPCP